MKGRKPKPTKLRIIEGNRGHRPIPNREPHPDPTMPTCPEWLRAVAKVEWKRICPILHGMGLMTQVDRTALAAYCQSYAKWKEAEEFVEKHGMTYQFPKKDETGKVVSMYIAPFPQVSIARGCLEQVKSFCVEFGLTPSSRARMTLPSEKQADSFDKLLDYCNESTKKA
jgi:P27 family predicted phage terminase small subunit